MKFKRNLKLKLMYILFVAVSFISVTLAWFAYSGLNKTKMDIDVKAWYIDFERNNEKASNQIRVTMPAIYPGMPLHKEKVKIKNMGDSDASVRYSIVSVRLLDDPDEYYLVDDVDVLSEDIEDKIAYDYPFHIHMNLNKSFAEAHTGESLFDISVSWPLDSGDNEMDSLWGTAAYTFQTNEQSKYDLDNSYAVLPAIEIVINVSAEQYVDQPIITGPNIGEEVLFDTSTGDKCLTVGDSCIATHIFAIGENDVTLIPDFTNYSDRVTYAEYSTSFATAVSSWNQEIVTESLQVSDVVKLLGKDVINTIIVRNNLSDMILGNLKKSDRYGKLLTILNETPDFYYKYLNESYPYLSSGTCIWINDNYSEGTTYAFKNVDNLMSKVYKESTTNECLAVPLIVVSQDLFN